MNIFLRRWGCRALLVGCGSLVVACSSALTMGSVQADDEPTSKNEPAASSPADSPQSGKPTEERRRSGFREAMQERLGGLGRGEGMRPDPDRIVAMLMDRFDEDGDEKLSKGELKQALGALRNMGGMLGGGPEGGGMGPGGPGGPGLGSMGASFIARLFEMNDRNGDGKLSGDELPERMRMMLDEWIAMVMARSTKRKPNRWHSA